MKFILDVDNSTEFNQDVLAVVVTYQPDDTLPQHLQALREQINNVVIVDNGSTNFDAVRVASIRTGCRLIRNNSNLGIAHALNQGAAIALQEGFAWLATFDQDSRVTHGMVSGLLAVYNEHPMKDKIGVLAAFHCDQETGGNYDDPRDVIIENDDWRILRTTITSGSFVSIPALLAVGPFDNSLFIDFVDHDFFMRCRQQGFLIVGSKNQTLLHSVGRTTLHRLLGRRVICSNHSALRRYYITRNRLEIYRRFAMFEPAWCVRGTWHLLIGSGILLILEIDRINKMRAMLKGAWHFITRRFGRLDGFP